jgi:hypothetical protein
LLSKEQKREAISKFKEHKPLLGVFAVRCTATGQVWVGSSRNLGAGKNGIWFALRNRSHRERGLQDVWDEHGESAFEYEILEKLEGEVAPLAVTDLLKERKRHWMLQLNAPGLL